MEPLGSVITMDGYFDFSFCVILASFEGLWSLEAEALEAN